MLCIDTRAPSLQEVWRLSLSQTLSYTSVALTWQQACRGVSEGCEPHLQSIFHQVEMYRPRVHDTLHKEQGVDVPVDFSMTTHRLENRSSNQA